MPEIVEKYMYPDLSVPLPSSPIEYQENLLSLFPEEETGIKQYFRDIKKMASWSGPYNLQETMPGLARYFFNKSPYRKKAQLSTKQYLDSIIKNPKLKAVLCSKWGDYGLPPSESSFAIHSLIENFYSFGGYFPEGGNSQFAKTMIPAIESAGGSVKINHNIKEIIIENGIAIGVRTSETRGNTSSQVEFFAPIIISDAGAFITYNNLIPKSLTDAAYLHELNRAYNNYSDITLYLGLKEDPRKMGFTGENYWIYTGYDHDQIFSEREKLSEGKVGMAFLSFPSLKSNDRKGHTAEIITHSDYNFFKQ